MQWAMAGVGWVVWCGGAVLAERSSARPALQPALGGEREQLTGAERLTSAAQWRSVGPRLTPVRHCAVTAVLEPATDCCAVQSHARQQAAGSRQQTAK